MNDIVSAHYEHLVEEKKAVKTEFIFQSRWALVEGYWNIGKLIRKEYTGNELTKQLQDLADDTGISDRTLWYSLQTFDKYPELDMLPEGKNISWNKLITTYLPQTEKQKEKPVSLTPPISQCSICKKWKIPKELLCGCN